MNGKVSKRYTIELDGRTYDWSKGQLRPVSEPAERHREGQTWFITDFGISVSKTMTIEAPLKYAEVIARKKTEESGEFDEQVSIITHWKKKIDNHTSDLFFTAVPIGRRQQHFTQAAKQPDSVLTFPLYAVLYGVLKRIRHPRPVMVLFHHDRFLDVVVGTKDQVYHANRYVAFDNSAEQISTIWEMLKTDIESLEARGKVVVDYAVVLDWVDNPTEKKRLEGLGKRLLLIGEETVMVDEQVHRSSFLSALKMQSGLWSASSAYEKLLYYCQRFFPTLNAALIVALIFCTAGYIWSRKQADILKHDLNALQTQVRAFSEEISVPNIQYQDVLSLVRDLERCRTVPSFKTLVNHVADALSEPMSVEILKADYKDDIVEIEVFGRAKSPFDEAYKGYQTFITVLKQNGYTVSESAFNTLIGESTFLAKLTKKV